MKTMYNLNICSSNDIQIHLTYNQKKIFTSKKRKSEKLNKQATSSLLKEPQGKKYYFKCKQRNKNTQPEEEIKKLLKAKKDYNPIKKKKKIFRVEFLIKMRLSERAQNKMSTTPSGCAPALVAMATLACLRCR